VRAILKTDKHYCQLQTDTIPPHRWRSFVTSAFLKIQNKLFLLSCIVMLDEYKILKGEDKSTIPVLVINDRQKGLLKSRLELYSV